MKYLNILALIYCSIDWSSSVSIWTSSIADSNYFATINDAMENILRTCYSDEKTMVIHGDFKGYFTEFLSNSHRIISIVLNNVSVTDVTYKNQMKQNLFLIMVNSNEEFEKQLLTLQSTFWWNIMATFIIINRFENNCKNARNILKITWKLNIITSLFLCRNSQGKLMIYSYNPYTKRALKNWRKIKTAVKQFDNWTMYNREYDKGNICNGLRFDRTKYLDGSKIKIILGRWEKKNWYVPSEKYVNNNITENMYRHDKRIVETMTSGLNVSIKVRFVKDDYHFSEDNIQDCFQPLFNASADLALCLRSPLQTYNFSISYPIVFTKFTIVTQRRGYYTPVEKIVNYYGSVTLISMIIILAMTFGVVFISSKRRKISFAAFEVLRLIVNVSLRTNMDTSARRIFFSVIFLYFLIIQATFQGHISAFLTKQEERRNVESLEDLKDPRYTGIYCSVEGRQIIEDPILIEKLKLPHSLFCVREVSKNKYHACIGTTFVVITGAVTFNLHFTKKFFGNARYVYSFRDDWPLKERFDIYLMRIEQSGLADRWTRADTDEFLTIQKRIVARSIVFIRPISLRMLKFALNIFIGGILISTICFILEKLVSK